MKQQSKLLDRAVADKEDDKFDLDSLRHPAKAFAHPMDVVHDVDLTFNEKRAILASWASDICAMEASSELRSTESINLGRWNDIMDAMSALNQEFGQGRPLPHYKKVLARRDVGPLRHRPQARPHGLSRRIFN